MKKLITLSAVIILLFTFASCGKEEHPYVYEDNAVTEGLYNYYKSKVTSSPEEYSATADDSASIDKAVKQCCSEYLAAIKLMEDEGIVLSSEFKRLAAENTENIWSLFSAYYNSIGVTKQDITRVQTHESRMLQLLDHFYGAEGKEPVKEMDMKERFVEMYVGFKAIEGSLTRTNDKGEIVPLTEKETKEAETLFSSMAKSINEGTASIDDLNVEYNDSMGIIVTSPLSVLLTKEGDPMYDDGFFSEVKSITHGRAKAVKSGDCIYVIERQTIATDDEDAFMTYRSEVLQDMRMGKIEKKLEKLISKMEIQENI
ncbi:MAG: hypothetical protein IKV21_03520 [Clostridia bacterium]|nr:hypothetical protein [Clostridia bacterium]